MHARLHVRMHAVFCAHDLWHCAEPISIIGTAVSPIIARTRAGSRAAREEIVFPRSDLRAIDTRTGDCAHRRDALSWIPVTVYRFRAIPILFLVQTGISTTIFRGAVICPKTWTDVAWRKFTSVGTDHVLVTANDPTVSIRNDAVSAGENKIFKRYYIHLPFLIVYHKYNLLRLILT